MTGAVADELPEVPEEGQPVGEPIELSEEEIQMLVSALGVAGKPFLFVGGRFIVVPDTGQMVDMAHVVAIDVAPEGWAEFVLVSGEAIRLPIDPREAVKLLFVAPEGEDGEVDEGGAAA